MISFCIITDGKEPDKTNSMIESIHELEIPDYEIVISGAWDGEADTYVPARREAHAGNLGKMRNLACRIAVGDILVVCDDDLIFHADFYKGLVSFGDFEILSCRILNPDGSRFWDWKTHNSGVNTLIDYDQTSPDISLTGGLAIMKREVFERVQWDESRGFYQCEDVDYSDRLKAAGIKIEMNSKSTVTHNARYTQRGKHIYRC